MIPPLDVANVVFSRLKLWPLNFFSCTVTEMIRTGYDRNALYLVTQVIEWPGKKKPYRIYPGTVIMYSHQDAAGNTAFKATGWYSEAWFDLSQYEDKVIDLEKFFSAVADAMGGASIPPAGTLVYEIRAKERTIRVKFIDSRNIMAEVDSGYEDGEYEVKLSANDFASPETFIQKIS